MPSQEDIDGQFELLETHRHTLAHLLKQRAGLGRLFAPPAVANGIDDARESIRTIKGRLKQWGMTVDDHPDDEEFSKEIGKVIRKKPVLILAAIIVLVTAVLALLALIVLPRIQREYTLNDKEIVAGLSENAQLVHISPTGILSDTDGPEEFSFAQIDLSNLIVEAKFYNPNHETSQSWSYGFAFRRAKVRRTNDEFIQYQYYIKPKESRWFFQKIEWAGNEIKRYKLAQGNIPNLDRSPNAFNKIRLVVDREKVYFLVNDQIIGKVDQLQVLQSGDALIETGFESTNPNESTRYENFSVWSISP